jgi:uncharacterized protein (DUF1330 family)
MTAYVIFDVKIRDMERYQEFMRKVKSALESAIGEGKSVSDMARQGADESIQIGPADGSSCM